MSFAQPLSLLSHDIDKQWPLVIIHSLYSNFTEQSDLQSVCLISRGDVYEYYCFADGQPRLEREGLAQCETMSQTGV